MALSLIVKSNKLGASTYITNGGTVITTWPSTISVSKLQTNALRCFYCRMLEGREHFVSESVYEMLWHVHMHLSRRHLHQEAVVNFTRRVYRTLVKELVE